MAGKVSEAKRLKALKLAKLATKCNGNLSEMARRRGVNKSTICRTINRPIVQKALAELNEERFKKVGCEELKPYRVVVEQMDANKVISCNVIAQDGEGMKDANSMTKDFVEVPDNTARLNAADKYFKLCGRYPDEKKSDESTPTVINIVPMVIMKTDPLTFDLGS